MENHSDRGIYCGGGLEASHQGGDTINSEGLGAGVMVWFIGFFVCFKQRKTFYPGRRNRMGNCLR